MAEERLDLAVYGPSPEFQYLTGLFLPWRNTEEWERGVHHLFVPREGKPCVTLDAETAKRMSADWPGDVRVAAEPQQYPALAADLLSGFPGALQRVALSRHLVNTPAVIPALWRRGGEIAFCPAEGLLDEARRIKDAGEILKLEAAAALTDNVMERILPLIREGVTQRDLELEIEFLGRRLGASEVSFPPGALFVQSGAAPTADPFVYPKDKGLVPGVSVAFDFGFVLDGYCSDYGRSFYFGPAGNEVRGAYRALQQAQLELISQIQVGETMLSEFFPILERTLDHLGFGDYLRARLPNKMLGHQIGMQVHENPWISPTANTPALPGMVMAIEPKLWHTGEYYLRVEDMVLIESGGARSLTHFDREMFVL
jgi:Xaa-Pro aminopeptidase/Xaa-Pro dipeptidase